MTAGSPPTIATAIRPIVVAEGRALGSERITTMDSAPYPLAYKGAYPPYSAWPARCQKAPVGFKVAVDGERAAPHHAVIPFGDVASLPLARGRHDVGDQQRTTRLQTFAHFPVEGPLAGAIQVMDHQ